MVLRTLISKSIAAHLPWKLRADTRNCLSFYSTFGNHYSTSSKKVETEINFENSKFQNYLDALRQEFYALRVNATGNHAAFERMKNLDGVVQKLEEHRALQSNMTSKEDIEKEKDEDMRKLIQEENEVYTDLLHKTEQELLQGMLLMVDNENYPALIFEVTAGVGGQEAMLFAQELFEMYLKYFEHHAWDFEVLEHDVTDIGGLRHANTIVQDPEAYQYLRHEAGVHRVQRVPATEKSGRIHTSTASVAVIPRPSDAQVHLAEKDLKIETKRASGAGGQHVNTTDSAVRVVHLPTGLAVESQTERSQLKNREIALKRLEAKLLQQQLETAAAKQQATRKAQQGTQNRNEKIRTYNFVQDRITDHRIQAAGSGGGTSHNLPGFLEGGEHLDNFINRLQVIYRKAKLLEVIAERQSEETRNRQAKKSN